MWQEPLTNSYISISSCNPQDIPISKYFTIPILQKSNLGLISNLPKVTQVLS